MSQTSEFAEKTAEICAAALFHGAAASITPVFIPLVALAALGFDHRKTQHARCLKAAGESALAAVKNAPELAGVNFERARLLITDAGAEASISHKLFCEAAKKGPEGLRGYLIEKLMSAVPFEPGDHLERRAVEAAFGASIDCFYRDPAIQAELTNHLVLDLVHGQARQIDLINDIRTAFADMATRPVSVKASYDDAAAQEIRFALEQANTVILGWYSCPSDWWEKTGLTLRSALDRLSDGATLVPEPWDFSLFERDSPRLSQARGALLDAFLGIGTSMHAATVLHIGNELAIDLPFNSGFAGRLAKHGLLAEEAGDQGFFDARAVEPRQRRAMIAAGAIPVTPETRLILETFLAGRPLLIWDDGTDAARCDEAAALLRWLAARGTPIVPAGRAARDDGWALEFVARVFDIETGRIPNPYRKLDHYLPSDAGDYCGRDREAAAARDWIDRARGAPEQACLRIGGPSGVGKSSFLNARVAPLAQEFGLRFVAFRPTDFEVRPNYVFSPVREFCALLEEALGGRAGLADHPLVNSPDPARAAAAAAAWIGGLRGKGTRFLIGVDQFEEILDNISNGWNAEAWRGLLSLLAALADAGDSLVCVTLETSRERLLDAGLAGQRFQHAAAIMLHDGDEAFLREVIGKPFADVGLRLGEDIVTTLLAETRQHQDEVGAETSSLPLLSLKLYGLFSHLTRHRAPDPATASNSFGGAARVVSMEDLAGYPLSIAEEIANLAEQAWAEVGGGGQDDLDTFIRPYVRVVPVEGREAARIVLQSVPARFFYNVADRQAAFIRRRLIVPAAGGFRLVHESVIRRWKFAETWFERERGSLLQQTLLAARAAAWAARGRPPVATPTAADIALAARILNASIIDWTMGDAGNLAAGATVERDYCLALFEHAADPRIAVEASPKGNRYIHLAAAYGLAGLVERFLDADPQAVAVTRLDGCAPLVSAAWTSPAIVSLLLERDADANAADTDGFAAIDAAIWGGNVAAFDILLPHADPALASEERATPLFGAARMGNHRMLERLEQRGFRHDAPARSGYTPLVGATICKDMDMFEYCLSRGDPLRRTAEGLNALDMLAQSGNLDMLNRLIKHPLGSECMKPDPQTGRTALMWTCATLMAETVAYLLKLGFDPNAAVAAGKDKGRTALHFCLDWLHRYGEKAPRFVIDQTRATLEVLLEDPAIDVSLAADNGDTAYGMLRHHKGLRDLVVSHATFRTVTLPASVETPLERAIAEGDRAALEAMLADPRHLAVVDRVDAKGETPAVAMIGRGFADLVRDLIRSGRIDPWQETPAYQGLLFTAWEAGETELLGLIVERMPERLSPGQFGKIVLCKSAGRRHFLPSDFDADDAILDRYLGNDPDPDALQTALLTAGRFGNEALFVRLVAAGANAWQADDWGRSILARSANRIAASRQVLDAVRARDAASAPGRTWSGDERILLASGDLDGIAALIAATGADGLTDSWRREPEDLVPDRCREAVRAMAAKKRDAEG